MKGICHKIYDNIELSGPEIYRLVGGVFWLEILTKAGQGFAKDYYEYSSRPKTYDHDFANLFGSDYGVDINEANFHSISIKIDEAYHSWIVGSFI